MGLCTWRITQIDSNDQSWYVGDIYIYISISALHIDLSGVVTALKTLMWEWPGLQTRRVNSQFSSSKGAETYSLFWNSETVLAESGVYFWGWGWQGMNTATQTEHRPPGKTRNRSTSHHQWQVRERNAWEGIKKENEDRKIYKPRTIRHWDDTMWSLFSEVPEKDEAVEQRRFEELPWPISNDQNMALLQAIQ